VAAGAPDPENPWPDAADPPSGDVLEGGMRPGWWRRHWGRLSRRARLLLVVLVVVLASGAGGLEVRDRAVERAAAERVDLTASIGLSSSSTTPPGGQVSFFLVVRNEGALPVRITSVEGSAGGLRIRMQDDVERQLSPDAEAAVPVSVRLTCGRYGGGAELSAEIAVRRADGAAVTRRVRPEPARLLLDVAATVCGSRPDLRDQELSGPVLDSLAADAPDR
jgi:hypothetical protein